MTMQLLDASARLRETRPENSDRGTDRDRQTSLLRTLPPELLPTTLLVDLKAGDLPVAHLESVIRRGKMTPRSGGSASKLTP